jgi:hypothetical protein
MDKLKEYLLRHKADLDVDSPADDTWETIGSKMSDETRQTRPGTGSGFPERSVVSSWRIRYAAAACLIVLAGAGAWLVIRNSNVPSDTTKVNRGMSKREPAPGATPGTTAAAPGTTAAGTDSGTDSGTASTPRPPSDLAQSSSGAKRGVNAKQSRRKAGLPKPVELSDQVDLIDKSYSSLIDFQLKKLRATPLYAENGSYFSFYVEQFKQMDQDEQSVRNDIKRYGLTNEFLEQLINVYQQKLNVLKNLETEINKMNNKVREKQSPRVQPELHYLNI